MRPAYAFLPLTALLLLACISSDEDGKKITEVNASIGNDCGPADAREVWLRVAEPVPGDTLPVNACPAYTDGGLRIRILEGVGLDSLKAGTYADLPVRDCGTTNTDCVTMKATVRIQHLGGLTVQGTYRLADSTGANPGETLPFLALRCVLTPLCG
jgi:hypothetical protein